MTDLPPAIVLGLDCLTGLQSARLLWRSGIPVVGVAEDPRSPYCRTRAAREVVGADVWGADPRPALRRWREQYRARPVLLPCSDDTVWWVDRHRSALAQEADFLIPSSDVLERTADKGNFYRHCIESGLRLTPTRFLRTEEELLGATREMGLPVVLKPPRRTRAWMEASGGRKVVRVDTVDAFLAEARRLRPTVDELIAQGWVEGGDRQMYSFYACTGSDGRALATMAVRKIRQWPPDIGVGSLAVQVDEPDVLALGRAVQSSLDFPGLICLQLKRDARTNALYVIEMNVGRPGLNLPVSHACGVEFLTLYHRAAAGLPPSDARTVTRPGVKWICWKTDLASAYRHWKRGELTLGAWLRSIRGARFAADVDWGDPLPFLLDLTSKLPESGRRLKRGQVERAER